MTEHHAIGVNRAPKPSRLSAGEALKLLLHADLADLMERADQVRRSIHGKRTYFVHSLNLNPTNICENHCELCAFWREPGAPDAYLLDLDAVRERLLEVQPLGLTDLHVVGGVTPTLNLSYYESLIRLARELLPSTLIQGLTAVEVHFLARQEKMRVDEVLRRLRDAGLGAIPGGGAEIFNPGVRGRICPHKISAEEWLSVHEQAHALHLPTNATMLFGHIETPEDVVDHLARLRALQDRTRGFQAFIPLPFHPDGTSLSSEAGPHGQAIVRTAALARIFLDNFPHVRVLANYMDRKLLQVLTHGGVDDVGGTSLDERIARAAGAASDHRFESISEMERELRALGLEPCLVNSIYRPADSTARAKSRLAQGRRATASPAVEKALSLAAAGKRLSAQQAVALHRGATLARLGRLAHQRRLQVVPGNSATFVIDRNLSITNVCVSGCRFCAFYVAPGADGAFTLSTDQIADLVAEAASRGATQIMLQGGLNPALDLSFYERMFTSIKKRTDIWVHSLSPAEVLYLSQRAGITVKETLQRLCRAGLDSLPGGGAEILVDSVRRQVSPRKITAEAWLDVMRSAHRLGLKTTATMVYGFGETPADRVAHLVRIRDLQEQTGGFTAFIPWSFQPNRTQLRAEPQTGADYLRMVALARLVLDNVPHVQAGWVTEGPDVAQVALSFGADDFGGILMEERVVRATGVAYKVDVDEVVALIRDAGMVPVQRTTLYEPLHVFPPK